jgi:hypothetical protein
MGTWCYLHLHLTCIALYRLFTTERPSFITSLFQLQDYEIDFDDVDHPIKEFKCRCGSEYCQGKKRVSSKCLKLSFVLVEYNILFCVEEMVNRVFVYICMGCVMLQ